MTTSIEHVNGHAEPAIDLVAAARAEEIRTRAATEAEVARIEAQGRADAERTRAEAEAEAARIRAVEDAEKQRLANERTRRRSEREQADHDVYVAKKRKEQAAHDREAREIAEQQQAQQQAEAQQEAELKRTEVLWKWGARALYVVGLVLAAPIQFLAFWDPERPFLVAAPALLEGLALVLAAGAAWAVANRRDVLRYRIGIILGALLAAGINLWHGIADPHIGMNAGVIGAAASLLGPIVLMMYEWGAAQKADGLPSRRERRADARAEKKRLDEEAAQKAAEEEAERKRVAEAAAAKKAAEEEQKRKDSDREKQHPEVWKLAEAMRSALGEPVVSDLIWADAWYHKTGSKKVGITPEIEAESRRNQAQMAAVTNGVFAGLSPQVDSQKVARPKKDPDAPDGRRFNGGTPPRRKAGDTAPYTPAAKTQASIEQTRATKEKGQ